MNLLYTQPYAQKASQQQFFPSISSLSLNSLCRHGCTRRAKKLHNKLMAKTLSNLNHQNSFTGKFFGKFAVKQLWIPPHFAHVAALTCKN